MCAVNFFIDLIDVQHPSDSLTNFLTFLFVRIFNISVCQNQIMYAHKHMQCVLDTDCLHYNIIKVYVHMAHAVYKVAVHIL